MFPPPDLCLLHTFLASHICWHHKLSMRRARWPWTPNRPINVHTGYTPSSIKYINWIQKQISARKICCSIYDVRDSWWNIGSLLFQTFALLVSRAVFRRELNHTHAPDMWDHKHLSQLLWTNLFLTVWAARSSQRQNQEPDIDPRSARARIQATRNDAIKWCSWD